jgi:hypothetical protein
VALALAGFLAVSCDSSEDTPAAPPDTPGQDIAVGQAAEGEQGAAHPSCGRSTPVEDAWPITVVEAGWSEPQPLPFPVNTSCVEDCPEISPDGLSLFFCWQDRVYGSSGQEQEAFLLNPAIGTYESRREGPAWSEPAFQDLGVGASWSIDMSTARSSGGQLVVFHSAREGNRLPIELYRARREGAAWSTAERLPDVVNGVEAGEAGVSPDGQAIIFASRRPGGLGGQDLWVTYGGGGTWTQPENLGAPVNTPYDELMAFIRADGARMYFNRGGEGHPHPGVYRSDRTGVGDWGPGAWKDPVQVLGGAVGEASVNADGSTLYFAHAYLSLEGEVLDVDVFTAHR